MKTLIKVVTVVAILFVTAGGALAHWGDMSNGYGMMGDGNGDYPMAYYGRHFNDGKDAGMAGQHHQSIMNTSAQSVGTNEPVYGWYHQGNRMDTNQYGQYRGQGNRTDGYACPMMNGKW